MATIAIEGISVHARHGVHAEEKAKGNHYEIDVYLETDIYRASETDALEDTLDYEEVYALCKSSLKEGGNLLEPIVVKIGKALLVRYNGVTEVKVRLSKLQPGRMSDCRRVFIEERFKR